MKYIIAATIFVTTSFQLDGTDLGEVLEPKCQRDAHLITYVKPITLLG
jgi:hypothetical protein